MEKVFEKKANSSKKINDVVGDDPMLKAGVDSLNQSEAKTARRKIIDPDEKKGTREHKRTKKTYDISSTMDYIENIIFDINQITKNDDIYKDSCLDLDNESLYYDINTDIFRKRFLTFFLIAIYEDIETMVNAAYELLKEKEAETPKEKTSKEYKLLEKMICKELLVNVDKLVRDLSTPGGMTTAYKWLIKIVSLDFCYPIKKEKNSFEEKYINNLEKCIPHMKEICKTDVFGKRSKYDDYIVLHLYRTAFCFAIESLDYERVIKHNNLKDCKLDCSFDKAMIMLGHGIKREIDRNKYMKVSPIYTAFVDAHPLIATTIPSCNKLEQTNVAIKTIGIIKFLCADENVNKVIDEILK